MGIERSCFSIVSKVLILASCFNFVFSGALDKCKYCSLMVDSFNVGIKRTENQHFAGGNTDWEERKLGKFAKSETRLVEILEYICKLSSLENTANYTGVKDVEFKCQELAEEHEETLENWYFHKQNSDPDLLRWLCFEKLKFCCLPGYYGKDCKPCPGVDRNISPCYGHGKCNGDGSREGTGRCICDEGYVGIMCSNCDASYYAVNRSSSALECKKCHQSCRSGCSSDGPKGCKECRSGWSTDPEKGCIDIDECAEGSKCLGPHEICVNIEGSFSCECKEGYVKDHLQNFCKLDVNEVNNSTVAQSMSDADSETVKSAVMDKEKYVSDAASPNLAEGKKEL